MKRSSLWYLPGGPHLSGFNLGPLNLLVISISFFLYLSFNLVSSLLFSFIFLSFSSFFSFLLFLYLLDVIFKMLFPFHSTILLFPSSFIFLSPELSFTHSFPLQLCNQSIKEKKCPRSESDKLVQERQRVQVFFISVPNFHLISLSETWRHTS